MEEGRRHRRGQGSVYYDANGSRYVVALSLGIVRGKRKRVKRTIPAPDGPSKALERQAERKLAELQRWHGRGGDIAFTTVADYLADWLDGVKPTLAPASWRAYETHIRLHISPMLGGIAVGALRPADVRRLRRDRLDAGKSAQTVVSIISTLRAALGQAVRDGDLERNVAMVEMPRVEREPVEAMTPERAEAILEAVKGDPHETLYVMLLGTGMRCGEACALDWGDLTLEAPTSEGSGRRTRSAGAQSSVFIRKGKSRAARRIIPLPRFVVTSLLEHRARAKRLGPGEPVFLGERSGERLTVSVPGRQFPRLMVESGLPRMTVHMLRHATATLLLQRGVPMRDIADILGHSNPALTAATYAHVSADAKRRAMGTLDEVAG